MDEKQKKELFDRVKEQEKTAHIHVPQQEATGNLPDFEVSYELDPDPELEEVIPCQGMRTDFLYDGDDPKVDGIHMIWPEFLDSDGDVITNKNEEISKKGKALMWILIPESRDKVHRHRIKEGEKGYWVFGSKKLARVTVTKILGLYKNK
ncbi:MAG: hypothetical protein IME94_09320 [Proteobacteria bacterium]|nr:hypothetical protein [Pseudomonadota bacterium]